MNWTKPQLISTRRFYKEIAEIPDHLRKAKVKEFDNLLEQWK